LLAESTTHLEPVLSYLSTILRSLDGWKYVFCLKGSVGLGIITLLIFLFQKSLQNLFLRWHKYWSASLMIPLLFGKYVKIIYEERLEIFMISQTRVFLESLINNMIIQGGRWFHSKSLSLWHVNYLLMILSISSRVGNPFM
jgi:hypothetical protein